MNYFNSKINYFKCVKLFVKGLNEFPYNFPLKKILQIMFAFYFRRRKIPLEKLTWYFGECCDVTRSEIYRRTLMFKIF